MQERQCLDFLEQLRWNGVVKSPFDLNSRVYACAHGEYKCKNSGKYFNVKTKTIFHNSKVPLSKWFQALELLYFQEFSASVLASRLNISIKSAALMKRKILKCIDPANNSESSRIHEIHVTIDPDKLPLSQWVNLLRK